MSPWERRPERGLSPLREIEFSQAVVQARFLGEGDLGEFKA